MFKDNKYWKQKIDSKCNFHKGKMTFMFTDVTTCFVFLEFVASAQNNNNNKKKKVYIAAYSKENWTLLKTGK